MDCMATTRSRAERAAQARAAEVQLTADGIDGVVFGWVDNAGLTRVKSVPLAQLEHAAQYGVGALPCFDVSLVDDSFTTTPSSTGPMGDLRLVPDLDRLTPLAAQPGWAWAPANRYTQDGTPHPGCQRDFARRATEAVERRGLSVRPASRSSGWWPTPPETPQRSGPGTG